MFRGMKYEIQTQMCIECVSSPLPKETYWPYPKNMVTEEKSNPRSLIQHAYWSFSDAAGSICNSMEEPPIMIVSPEESETCSPGGAFVLAVDMKSAYI